MTRGNGEGTTYQALAVDATPGARAYCIVYHEDRSWHVDLRPESPLEIGRSRTCGVYLPDEKASRLHATLSWDGTNLLLHDLGSTNGTKVNGKRVRGELALRSGDEVAIGAALIVVGLTAPASGSGRRVLAHADFEERLAEEVSRAGRYRRGLALLMIQLPTGSSVPESVLREMDILGAYGPTDLEVMLPEVDGPGAQKVSEQMVAALPGARVGLALFPSDATDHDQLIAASRAALRQARPESPVHRARQNPVPDTSAPVAIDAAMQRVFSLVDRVAARDIAVLITGETGSGKEIVAREVHRRGRGERPFIAVNCAALPESIVDSELFGHEKGSFTGAGGRKKGLFEAAHGGSIFLDEVGELGATTQARLLRVLERHEVLRVGATEPISIDVRVIAATHRDLDKEVQRGAFREDLLFRLNAFAIAVPALRDRPGDLAALCERFLAESAQTAGRPSPKLTEAARTCMRMYAWPGNVRELRNAIERAVVLCAGDEIDVADLPDRVRKAGAEVPAGGGGVLQDSIDALERESLVRALESCKGNQSRAAKALGISRRALIYKMEKYGLKKPAGSGR